MKDAGAKGGQIVTGGQRDALQGNFWQPTVIAEAYEQMMLSNEKTLGPIADCFRFGDEEWGIRRANDN